MKLIALISGGKDSTLSIIKAIDYGHEVVALANLFPSSPSDHDINSYMYQTVGHTAITAFSKAINIPLYRKEITRKAINKELIYEVNKNDEIEDLFELIELIKRDHPKVDGVLSGAVLSKYQKNRVENVCDRLNLKSINYLWNYNQRVLLKEIINNNIMAIIIKTSSYGLIPDKHINLSIKEIIPYFYKLEDKFGFNVSGEGGEYETFTLDCPLFNKKINIEKFEIMKEVTVEGLNSVGYMKILEVSLKDK